MTRLATLMGGDDKLAMAKRAAARVKCENTGGHRWHVIGAEKGHILKSQCDRCGTIRKESFR